MNVRRRSGDMTRIVGVAPKNTVNNRKDAPTQARGIANTVNQPSPCKVQAVSGAVSKNR